MKKLWIVLFVMAFAAGCMDQSPQRSLDADDAKSALVNFFELLNTKKYEAVIPLYGGSYEVMQAWNPSVEPSDHAALWEKACEQNGLMCLEVRTVSLKDGQDGKFLLQVEFNNSDGSLFVRGPCCGASETEMPSESQFEYTVIKSADGKFLVMDLPPYVP